jgi:hypothetical protein
MALELLRFPRPSRGLSSGLPVLDLVEYIRDPRFITVRRGGTLQDGGHRLLARWAADCAEHCAAPLRGGSAEGRRSRAPSSPTTTNAPSRWNSSTCTSTCSAKSNQPATPCLGRSGDRQSRSRRPDLHGHVPRRLPATMRGYKPGACAAMICRSNIPGSAYAGPAAIPSQNPFRSWRRAS